MNFERRRRAAPIGPRSDLSILHVGMTRQNAKEASEACVQHVAGQRLGGPLKSVSKQKAHTHMADPGIQYAVSARLDDDEHDETTTTDTSSSTQPPIRLYTFTAPL